MNTTASLEAIVLLLIANGFFVAAEFALVKARGFRIEALANGGSAAAHCLDVSGDVTSNLALIKETEHSRLPVIDGDHDDAIVGILLAKDLYRALIEGESQPWQDLRRFCREPVIVPESQRVARLFELIQQRRAHMAFVVDEYGAFIGLVTLEDLLEEIVGEIHDETDDADSEIAIRALGPGRWEADGLVSLGDLARATGLVLPPELDANTLSGLFMDQLARMPEPGDEIREGDYVLCVLSIEGRRVGLTTIERKTEKVVPDMAIAADGGGIVGPRDPD